LKSGDRHEVVAVAAPRIGLTAASIASMKLIEAFRPRYLAMIGITAGIRGRCQMGDIVVADPCWDWGSGKMTVIGSTSKFQLAPHQIGIDSFVRAKLRLLAQDDNALDGIRRSWKGTTIDNVLRMHIGPAASGASVLADSNVTKQIVEQHRNLLAIEMENYGVYAASQDARLPQPKAFSMKSICDFADGKKNDDHQRYASFTSAQSLKSFVESYL
jgi:nucleoside phosphorylase